MSAVYADDHISGWMSGRTLQAGFENDMELLSAVGVKADEVSNGFLTATHLKLNGASKRDFFNGLVNTTSDVDFYAIDSRDLRFSIIGGGNCDIQVDIYDVNEQPIAQFNDYNNLGISEKTIKTKGKRIYLRVSVNDLLIGDLFSKPQFAGQYTLVVEKSREK